MTALAAALISNKGRAAVPHWHNTVILLFLSLMLAGYARAWFSIPDVVGGSLLVVLTPLYLLLYLLGIVLASQYRPAVTSTLIGIVLLHLLNIALWAGGVQNVRAQAEHLREFDSMFNFGSRLALPLSDGLPSSAMISGLGGLSALALYKWSAPKRKPLALTFLLLATVASSCLGIILAGNRVIAVVFAVASFLLLLDPHLPKRRSLVVLIAFLYLFPVLYLAVYPLVESSGADWLLTLSRSGDGSDLLTFSNRVFVWEEVVTHFRESSSNFWFGYGAYGQVSSGISTGYAKFFDSGWVNPELSSPHSAVLQLLTNVGAVGAAGFLAIVMLSLRKVQAVDSATAGPLSVILLALVGFSSIEAGPVSDELVGRLFFFILALVAAMKPDVTSRMATVKTRAAVRSQITRRKAVASSAPAPFPR